MDNGLRIDFKDMARVVGETWRTLTAREKAPYEADARKESAQYEQERRKYEEKHKVWADLHHKAKASGRSLRCHAHHPCDSQNSVRQPRCAYAFTTAKEQCVLTVLSQM